MASPPAAISTDPTLALDYFAVDAKQSLTVQNYLKTLQWTLVAVLACVVCYAIEKYFFMRTLGAITDVHYRMFKNPAELPMRLFGLPHFIVGLLFMVSSKRMQGARSWGLFAALLVVGVGLCAAFAIFGFDPARDRIHPLALLCFYFYFLIHGFRDEAYFYRAYGEAPKDSRTHDRIMVVLQALMLGLLISLAIPGYVIFGRFFPKFQHPGLDSLFPAAWPYPLYFAITFLPMVALAVFALWRISLVFPDRFVGLWRVHRPILIVFLIGTGIILLALGTGPWTFNVVVLMHFVGWYIFGRYKLGQHEPATPPASTWKWMRTTKLGFTVLHLGLAAVIVAIVAVSVYVDGKSGPLELVFGSKSFFYWTILHVTLSFYPR